MDDAMREALKRHRNGKLDMAMLMEKHGEQGDALAPSAWEEASPYDKEEMVNEHKGASDLAPEVTDGNDVDNTESSRMPALSDLKLKGGEEEDHETKELMDMREIMGHGRNGGLRAAANEEADKRIAAKQNLKDKNDSGDDSEARKEDHEDEKPLRSGSKRKPVFLPSKYT